MKKEMKKEPKIAMICGYEVVEDNSVKELKLPTTVINLIHAENVRNRNDTKK